MDLRDKLETDGIGYDLLERAIAQVTDVPGLFLEIGTRRGGSMQIMIDAALSTNQPRTFVSIDPYGNIPYHNGQGITKYDYTNRMKCEALSDLYGYAARKGVNLVTFTMDDAAFMGTFYNGIPIYEENKRIENRIAFAFLDGPHDVEAISAEMQWLLRFATTGTRVVIDNIDLFKLEELEPRLSANWVFVEKNEQKICYLYSI